MKNRLLTPELLAALKPFPLYSQEETRIHEQKALAAFAIGPIRWYITEGSPEGDTFTFFGLDRALRCPCSGLQALQAQGDRRPKS